MPRRSWTLQGFGYPFNVPHLPASRVLFHTRNARRVYLTELFAWSKAATISGSLLPCRSFYGSKPGSRGTQTLNLKTQASKLCSLNQAVPWQILLGVVAGPCALIGLSPLRPTLKPWNRLPCFSSCAVIPVAAVRHLPKTCLRVLPVWAFKNLFQNPKALLVFVTPSVQKIRKNPKPG